MWFNFRKYESRRKPGSHSVDGLQVFNHGTVNIIGNTNITAAEGKVACDVFYWPENGYGDGVNVTVNTTGIITGNITYGTDGTPSAQSDAKNKAKLNIQGGTLKGDLSTYDLGENPTGIEVSGGSFTDLADAVKYAKRKGRSDLLMILWYLMKHFQLPSIRM